MSRKINFDNDTIIKIFSMRAKGVSMQDIGRNVGCSETYIKKILLREKYPHVLVNPMLAKKVNELSKKRFRTKKTKAVIKTNGSAVTRAQALAYYAESCLQMQEAKGACRKMGVPDDMLSLLQEGAREA